MERYPFDLHTHSNASDGDFPPEHVFRSAKRLGLRGLVLTDHNTTTSMDVSQQLARRYCLQTFEGIEVSSRAYGVEFHVLGYAKKFRREILDRGLRATQQGYTAKAKQQVALARRLAVAEVTFADIQVIRPRAPFYVKYDVMRALAKKPGLNLQRAKQMLNRGGELFVPYGTWALSPRQAVGLIRRSGGVASLAHLGEARRALQKTRSLGAVDAILEKLVAALVRRGVRGLELQHISHTPDDLRFLKLLIRRYRLLPTGGSDYHGKHHHPKRRLGRWGVTASESRRLYAALP